MITDYDITYLYRHAVNKVEQVSILAQLTGSDEDTIIQILKNEGVLDERASRHRICCRCGKEYRVSSKRGLPVCPQCRDVNVKIKEIEHDIRRNNARIAEHIRNMGKLTATNERLRKEIEELKEGNNA